MPFASQDGFGFAGPDSWLQGLLVVEMGDRIAAGACGSLLAQAGANVVYVESRNAGQAHGKRRHRDLFAAGKHSLLVDDNSRQDLELLNDLLARADFVLLSSDMDEARSQDFQASCSGAAAIVDFTAFGSGSDHAMARQPQGVARAYSDAMVQALSGVAHISGFVGGPPVPLRVPVLEYSAAVYGAAACLAALRSGVAQTIDVALFDCALNSLTTFLPALYADKDPGRLGNGHAMAAPWNAYRAMDGWLLLCSTTDAQWQRICQAMETPQYAVDPRFTGLNQRMANRDALDAVVGEWVAKHDVLVCAERLSTLELACGSIVDIDTIASEPNLAHRGMVRELTPAQGGPALRVPGSVLRNDAGVGRVATHIVAPDESRQVLQELCSKREVRGATAHGHQKKLPLDGVRVLEVGQYTTAPLTARHLATLGAEVIRFEPPGGDVTRVWEPCVDGLSVFFVMSNSGKKSFIVDLKTTQGRAACDELIRSADVLVENLKPGSFARLGFDTAHLARTNPRIIYCSISGFGNDTVYRGRPAFDTVVQAMSGVMSANAVDGMPLKAGVSACDFMGGEVALFAILAALHRRQHSARGEFIDLSMQDVGAWMTASLWNGGFGKSADGTVVACKDGFVLIMASREVAQCVAESPDMHTMTREQVLETLADQGIDGVPVLRVSEAAAHPLVAARKIIVKVSGFAGHDWPLLGSPMMLSKTPPVFGIPIGAAEEMTQQVLSELCPS